MKSGLGNAVFQKKINIFLGDNNGIESVSWLLTR
jgi:hypothetical protein